MKICSFDVGIKNLAYCIIKKKDDDFSIIKWDIINIDDEDLQCSHCKTDGTQCQKKAKFYAKQNENNIGFCKFHKKNYIIPDKSTLIKKNKDKDKELCGHINCNGNQCKKKSLYIFNKKKYCKNHADMLFRNNYTLKKVKIKPMTSKIQQLSCRLYHKLDKLELYNVDEVLIENQPSLKAPTMKTIATLLYSYFILRGKIDGEKIQNVKFISPLNKLKLNGVSKKKITYKLTKSLGIKYCTEIIKHNDKYLKILNKFKKKDDMCDAFLQGYHYLFCKDKIPKKIIKMLKNIT